MSYESALSYVREKHPPKPSLKDAMKLMGVMGGFAGGYTGSSILGLMDKWLGGIVDPMAMQFARDDKKVYRGMGLGADYDGDVISIYPMTDEGRATYEHRLRTPYCKDHITTREWLKHERYNDSEEHWVFPTQPADCSEQRATGQIRIAAASETRHQEIDVLVAQLKEIKHG